MAEIRAWYDGYNVPNNNLKLYNVFSIVNCLESRECKNYWVQSGYVKNLEKIFFSKCIISIIEEIITETRLA